MFRSFWLVLFLFGVCSFANSNEWKGSDIDYGGLTIQCKWGCGDESNPCLRRIYSILQSTIQQLFKEENVIFLDKNMKEHFVTPWVVKDFRCEIYDWETAKESWEGYNSKTIAYWSHRDFQFLTSELQQDMVPELRELIQNYDQLDDYEKGSLIGEVIGRYGVDILACKYSTKAVKAYTELKKANQAMTLEALASPATKQKILEEAGKYWAHRETTLKNGNLKVQWGKQGKHVVGDNNYVPRRNRSIWEYTESDSRVGKWQGGALNLSQA